MLAFFYMNWHYSRLSAFRGAAVQIQKTSSGGVPERPKGSDCKSDAKASLVRIQPPPPE